MESHSSIGRECFIPFYPLIFSETFVTCFISGCYWNCQVFAVDIFCAVEPLPQCMLFAKRICFLSFFRFFETDSQLLSKKKSISRQTCIFTDAWNLSLHTPCGNTAFCLHNWMAPILRNADKVAITTWNCNLVHRGKEWRVFCEHWPTSAVDDMRLRGMCSWQARQWRVPMPDIRENVQFMGAPERNDRFSFFYKTDRRNVYVNFVIWMLL